MKKLLILLFLGLAFGCSKEDNPVVEKQVVYYLLFNEECYTGLEGQFRFDVKQDIYETFSRKEIPDCSSVYHVPGFNGKINVGYHVGQGKD